MGGMLLKKGHFSKKHPYTIVFDYILAKSLVTKQATYTGTDFTCEDISKEISEEAYNTVLNTLHDSYGYGPFSKDSIQQSIKKCYYLNW